jgi:beta-1,4-mannosyltransferase
LIEINPLRIAVFPYPFDQSHWMHSQHPILLEIAKELEAMGQIIVPTPNLLTLGWLVRNHKKFDVLHLNWPELYYDASWYRYNNPNPGPRLALTKWVLKKILGENFSDYTSLWWYQIFITLIHWFKIPIVWTLHDLYGNAVPRPVASKFEMRIRKNLMENIKVLILNSPGIENLVKEKLGICPHVVVAPLGGYRKFYPDNIDRLQARRFFDLSDQETSILFFGTQRIHRNCLELLDVFTNLEDKNLRLLIAGSCDFDLRATIEKKSWGDWRIRYFLQRIPNDQVEYFLKAADLMVMPSKDYLTSAVIALAMSYGVPTVAPDFGCTPYMVSDAGVLYPNGGTQTDLRQALLSGISHLPELTRNAQKQMKNFGSWKYAAEQINKAYELAIEVNITAQISK